KGRTPLDNRADRAHRHASSAVTHELYNTGAGGRETGRAPACNHEERDMWAILFSLALAAAVCFGGAAVVLVYSKYLGRVGGWARLRGAPWGVRAGCAI